MRQRGQVGVDAVHQDGGHGGHPQTARDPLDDVGDGARARDHRGCQGDVGRRHRGDHREAHAEAPQRHHQEDGHRRRVRRQGRHPDRRRRQQQESDGHHPAGAHAVGQVAAQRAGGRRGQTLAGQDQARVESSVSLHLLEEQRHQEDPAEERHRDQKGQEHRVPEGGVPEHPTLASPRWSRGKRFPRRPGTCCGTRLWARLRESTPVR